MSLQRYSWRPIDAYWNDSFNLQGKLSYFQILYLHLKWWELLRTACGRYVFGIFDTLNSGIIIYVWILYFFTKNYKKKDSRTTNCNCHVNYFNWIFPINVNLYVWLIKIYIFWNVSMLIIFGKYNFWWVISYLQNHSLVNNNLLFVWKFAFFQCLNN